MAHISRTFSFAIAHTSRSVVARSNSSGRAKVKVLYKFGMFTSSVCSTGPWPLPPEANPLNLHASPWPLPCDAKYLDEVF